MLTLIKDWPSTVVIGSQQFVNGDEAQKAVLSDGQPFEIRLIPKRKQMAVHDTQEYRFTVKSYMTKKSEAGFDFMKQWNNDIPMPLCTMIGTIDNETKGMFHIVVHGDIYAEKICTCMKCGKALTNPVSQYFGIGPECGGHHYVHPFDSDEELKQAVGEYRKTLQRLTWSGWIPKSAIITQEAL